jgi:5,10-methylenetetrahydromethanopterin reductase
MTATALGTKLLKIGVEFDPYRRHPVLQAAALLSLDEIAQGRAIMAIGAGGPEELIRLGYKVWERPLTILRESVTVIRRLFDGETVDFAGRMVRVCGAHLFSKTQGKIPIYLCARSEQMLRLAGEIGDGIWSASPFPRLKDDIALIEEGTRKAGRKLSELDIANSKPIFISNDRREALKNAKTYFPAFLLMISPRMLETLGIEEHERDALLVACSRNDINAKIKRVTKNMLDAFVIHGTAEDCMEKIKCMLESGVTQIIFSLFGSKQRESLALLGNRVIKELSC